MWGVRLSFDLMTIILYVDFGVLYLNLINDVCVSYFLWIYCYGFTLVAAYKDMEDAQKLITLEKKQTN